MAGEFYERAKGKEQVTPSLHSDSQSVIDLAYNPVYYDRGKQINVQYHSIRILLKDGVITCEDIHESESRKHAGQGRHDGEAEYLLSLCGSSSMKIRS